MLKPNDVINERYQVIREIGTGGIGVIYLAYHLNLQKYVVIKKIKDDFVGRIEVRNEVDIMKNLSHTYLPQIYDFIQLGTEIYTVMNYIEGFDFSHYIKAGYHFSEEQLTKWLTQCLEVLEYLHTRTPAIIHRDIKPANIMLDKDGNICLIDFNISFDEESGSDLLAASKAYAPPEQLHPQAVMQSDGRLVYKAVVDARSDIYSLGATFYHLATGIKPEESIIHAYPITQMELGYTEAFAKIVEKAMQSDPNSRYQSAAEMLSDVRNIYKHTKQYRIIRAGIVTGACMIGILIGCAGIWGYRYSRQKNISEFVDRYDQVIQLDTESNPETVKTDAMKLLNEEAYRKYFKQSPEKKGMLLYQIAKSYFSLEDYEQSSSYYEEALQYISDSGCIRDYALALIRSDQITKAERIVDNYAGDLNEYDKKLIYAEISFENGDYEDAENELTGILRTCSNLESRSRIAIQLCELYCREKKYKKAVDMLTTVKVSSEFEDKKYRILADAYMGLASLADQNDKTSYYKYAKRYLESLRNQNKISLEEAINLIVIYQNEGAYTDAAAYINELLECYPNDYRLLVQKTFLSYNREVNKTKIVLDFSDFKQCYEQAIQAYEKQTDNIATDNNVEQLERIFQELKDKGYL